MFWFSLLVSCAPLCGCHVAHPEKKKFNGEVEKNESLQNLPSKVRVLLCPQGSLP